MSRAPRLSHVENDSISGGDSERSAVLPSDRPYLAAIHAKHRAGHPPCRRRYDERHNVRYFLRFTKTANAGLPEELLLASSSVTFLEVAAFSSMASQRPVMIAPGETQLTWMPSSIPRSANVFGQRFDGRVDRADCSRICLGNHGRIA